MTTGTRLHHEDLDAYQASIEFLALASTLLGHYPRGNAALADQLRRASLSIPLNIALVEQDTFLDGKTLLVRIVSMLVKMTQ